MKVFHHNDNDGRCAAAIVRYELESHIINNADNFIEYDHTKGINFDFDTLIEGEHVYIVDLALDDVIFKVIKECYKRKCVITFIDHHKTTVKRLEKLTGEEKKIIDSISKFVRIGISGTLLTYIWSCMSEDERKDPNTPFDFSDKRTHVLIGKDIESGREYHIPLIVRWVDDYDVWIHDYKESKIFSVMSSLEADLSPYGDFWECIYSNDILVYKKFITPGEYVMKYIDSQNHRAQKYMYDVNVELNGREYKGIMYNGYGNSFVFGDKFNEYDVCFVYHENDKGVKVSLYSREDSEFDCSKYAEKMGGGGHQHAAGYFTSNDKVYKCEEVKQEEEKQYNSIQKFIKKLFKI